MADDEGEGGKVIPVDFRAKPDGPVPTVVRPTRRHASFYRITVCGVQTSCPHPQIVIDEQTLDLECQECKTPIDARLFVLEWARRLRRLEWTREEVTRLNAEAERLRREIKNLKAQVRRARGKAEP